MTNLQTEEKITEEEIRSLSHEELIQAVIRMTEVRYYWTEEGDLLVPREVAEAFRDKEEPKQSMNVLNGMKTTVRFY